MTDLPDVDEEASREAHLHIKLLSNRLLSDGEWSKRRFLDSLKCKLMRHDKMKSLSVCTKEKRHASFNTLLRSAIHSGVYDECILLELEDKGMPPHSILKAIRYGLLSLSPEELKYFQDSGSEMQRDTTDTWVQSLDERLISNLSVVGLTREQCWAIVAYGLVPQDEAVLYRLLSSGVDVPGILNWPRQDKSVTPTVIHFLRKLGTDEDTIRYVEENGIDDELEDILIDLGYNECKEKEDLKTSKEILCECSLTVLESPSTLLEEKIDAQYCIAACTCICNLSLFQKDQDGETLERNNYLRQTIMVPLSWALSRALRYRPSDPKHYIAYQLLRWRYGNVSKEEKHYAHEFVISATRMMDQRFLKERKTEDAFRHLNEAVKDIPCDVCLEGEKFYRVKERCWKCTRVPTSHSLD